MTVEWLAKRVNELICLFWTVRCVLHAGRWQLNLSWKNNWRALGWQLLTRRNPPFITCRGKIEGPIFFLTWLQCSYPMAFLWMITKWNFDHSLQLNIAVSTDVRLFIFKEEKVPPHFHVREVMPTFAKSGSWFEVAECFYWRISGCGQPSFAPNSKFSGTKCI